MTHSERLFRYQSSVLPVWAWPVKVWAILFWGPVGFLQFGAFAVSAFFLAISSIPLSLASGQEPFVPIAEAPDLNGQPPAPHSSKLAPPVFQDLFDGNSLEGWVQKGGQAEFRVEDGAIVGKTRIATPNSFLCTKKEFEDFDLQLEFKLDSDRVNSGVQIRSNSLPEYKNGRVHGYQVEIDPTSRGWTGGIYDEARRGWLYPVKNRPDAQAAFRLGQWNKMRVVAEGNRIKTWINEIPVAELTDDAAKRGFIALQVHASNEVMPLEIRWRNIRLKELPRTESSEVRSVDVTKGDLPEEAAK